MKVNRFNLLRWVAIFLLVSSLVLFVFQLTRFSRLRSNFSTGTRIAGIAVGGLNQQQAAERIMQAFNFPIELVYMDQHIQVKPSQLGFVLNTNAMIAVADQQRVTLPFWSSFWDYLWNRPLNSSNTPLQASIDENRIRSYLMDEIAPRYDQAPTPSIPIPGSINFQAGSPGSVLDIEKSLLNVSQALKAPVNRSASLVIKEVPPPRPSLENLEVLLKQIIDQSNFDGLTEVFVLDLEKREEFNFAYESGVNFDPGIAFTAASTIKIPIMVSVFRKLGEPTPQAAADLMKQMIEKSENPSADKLMEIYLDPNIGPLFVTQDMQAIGLQNTFLAGHFYLGAPLLERFSTPANQRFDYTTDPDVYNQTTTSDMGMLLDDIYQCAQTGGGTFSVVFGDEITQSECQLMITYLTQNKIAVLLQAGLPDGTNFGHKHGWITESDGLIHTILDAGIVFSPKGNYIVVIAMYQPTQLIFDIANLLSAQTSTAIYNYFNIS
ncbi:MAG: serine hydrolase [Anaerolineaceae bacterium]|nr:serine hydrolase [Anaerolineaceae bacterium]